MMSGFVLGRGEGSAYEFHGAVVVIKATGQDTAGQLSVMESSYPPALTVHPHVHAGEDEMFFMLEGELTGFCDGDRRPQHQRVCPSPVGVLRICGELQRRRPVLHWHGPRGVCRRPDQRNLGHRERIAGHHQRGGLARISVLRIARELQHRRILRSCRRH
jgi:hypothetical protein